MKKRVSAELISIAHRILKLKNHSETIQLQQEAKNLYDQLTILRFYEENFELVKNEISEEVLEAKLEGKQSDIFEQPIPVVEEVAPEKEAVPCTVIHRKLLSIKKLSSCNIECQASCCMLKKGLPPNIRFCSCF